MPLFLKKLYTILPSEDLFRIGRLSISHKSSMLEYFQKTCVLKNGKIQDYGLTSNLINKNKFLKKMAN